MDPKTVVLVTGVAGYWGRRLAARLAADPALHVLGLDATPPVESIKGLDFIQADVRNPLLVDVLRQEAVQKVCHLAFRESGRRDEAAFDLNVMGTMKVLGACAEAGVGRIVLRSSTAVYGARADNSAFLSEDHALNAGPRTGTLRDLLEIEAFCNGFQRQAPASRLTALRFAHIIGPTVDSPLTRFLRNPLAPILLGFDPLMQVIHEDDVVEALAHALGHPTAGVFNIAAEGVLPLSKLMALAGKMGVPVVHLAAYWGNPLLAGVGLPVYRFWPLEPDALRYPCVGDLAQMRDTLGFTPKYTSAEALREFAGSRRLRPYQPRSAAATHEQEVLRDTLARRRRTTAGRDAEPPVMAHEDEEETI
jgi:UDP-glucose 4-epimerase